MSAIVSDTSSGHCKAHMIVYSSICSALTFTVCYDLITSSTCESDVVGPCRDLSSPVTNVNASIPGLSNRTRGDPFLPTNLPFEPEKCAGGYRCFSAQRQGSSRRSYIL